MIGLTVESNDMMNETSQMNIRTFYRVYTVGRILFKTKAKERQKKTYADVFADWICQEMKWLLIRKIVKRVDAKEGIDLNAILVNLTEEKVPLQHATSPAKLCSDTSTTKNSWNCFNKQVILDGVVDGEMLQLLDDLLNLF